jgi:hypothetical protein
MPAGNGAVRPQWKALFAGQPRRAFRFGYPNKKGTGPPWSLRRGATTK